MTEKLPCNFTWKFFLFKYFLYFCNMAKEAINNQSVGNRNQFFDFEKKQCKDSKATVILKEREIYTTESQTFEEDDPTAHAAIHAIRKTRLKERKFLLNDYEIELSKQPCDMCLLAIYQSGIKNIYYTEKETKKHILLTPKILKKAYTIWEF